ncbi:MAG: sodium:proline symporter, partial [Leptospiraceae bacterium]|nr:sodium:proline symporter [Leptospiraceae bacterium]
GYIAQRILATKDEKSATLSSLWFTFAHYFLRPWPWILVALASLILYPNLAPNESGKGFVYVMRDLLPNGLLGLLLASFLAAYLSTIATHLNWGASYLIYDFYKPYIKSYEKDSHYLLVTKLIELLFMVSSIWITFYALESISGTWSFLIEASAGVGFALVARWFLPIISAWGELVGFIVPLIIHFLGKNFQLWDVNLSILYNTSFTVLLVLLVSYFTKEDFETLKNFYLTVRPPGVFWKTWAQQNNLEVQESELSIFNALLKVLVVLVILYLGLFSIGKFLLG